MRIDMWTKTEEMRQPGLRRVLEGMRLISKEMPGLGQEEGSDITLPIGPFTGGQPEGGHPAQ